MAQYPVLHYSLVSPHIAGLGTLLDFGCGDLGMAQELTNMYPRLRITGIDVVAPESFVPTRRVRFFPYDGIRIPFPARSFDGVFASHVFHHTNDPEAALRECVRVAKKKLIFIEPVLRHPWEKPGFCFMDSLANVFRKEKIPMPFTVQSYPWWKGIGSKLKLTLQADRAIHTFPAFLPIGETHLFVFEKRHIIR